MRMLCLFAFRSDKKIVYHSTSQGSFNLRVLRISFKISCQKNRPFDNWGKLKVSGLIDNFKLKEINLAPRKGEDKIISINKEIRNSIGKGAGDKVKVTLYLYIPDRNL